MNREEKISYGKIVSKCWAEEDFKKRFMENPVEVLKEFSIEPEDGVEYQVIDAEVMVQYIVLPHEDSLEGVQQFSKLLLQKSETSNTIIPEGAQVRLVQDTATKRYLVIPFNPQLLTEVEFGKQLVADSVTTYQDVAAQTTAVAQAEVAVEVVAVEATTIATSLHVGAEAVAVAVIGIVFI